MASQFRLPFIRVRRLASLLPAYVRLVIAAGLLVLGVLLLKAAAAFRDTDLTFWLLAACALPAEIIRFRATHRGEVHHFTLSRPFALALLTGWPITAAVLVFVFASVVSDLNQLRHDPKPLVRVPFNAAQYVLSLTAAGATYVALGGQPSLGLEQVPAFFTAAVVLLLVNQLLVRIAMALSQQQPITIRFLLALTRIDLLEGAVQCGVVLIALLVAGQRPLLPLLLALPALPLFVAARATEQVEILRRARPLGRNRGAAQLDERREAVQALLRATELERVKLAADLHDGPLQQIDQFVARIQEVQAGLDAGRLERSLVEQLGKEVPALGRNLRSIVAELRPPVMQRFGLVGALTHLAQEFQTTYRIVFDVQASPIDQLSEELEVVLYRVTQEALTNIVKHSRASHVQVTVAIDDGVVRLQIHDNGSGFDPALIEGGHYGLAIMRDRVEMVGGAFQIDSTLGHGSTITLDIEVDAQP
jgi:signal transduction histidine kinase